MALDAQGSVPNVNFVDASLRFQLRSESGVDWKLISGPGLSPLIGLSKMQRGWLKETNFGPALADARDSGAAWDFVKVD